MALPLFDSHAHLTSDAVFNDIENVLARAQAAGLKNIINICTDRETLLRGVELAKKHPWIFNTAATTPHDVEKWGERDFDIIAEHARKGALKAVGETGLDYYYEHSPRKIQKDYFIKYLHLALECKLPIIIHCRDAFSDFFEILDVEYKTNGQLAPGILHCFTGTVNEAQEIIKRGWMLSLSGIVTFKKSTELHEVAKIVPIDQLLIETDTPYLAPMPYRGKQNEPAYIVETASFIASLRGVPPNEIAESTYLNATKFFNI